MLKLPHTGLGVCPLSLLPTHRQTAQAATPEGGSVGQHQLIGETVTTEGAELASDLLPSPSPTSDT